MYGGVCYVSLPRLHAGSDAKEKVEEEEERREKGIVWYRVSYDVCVGASCVTYSRLHANRQTL